MKIYFVWIGLVVEEYRKYLDELSETGCEVRAIAPYYWHEASQLKKIEKPIKSKNYEIYPLKAVFNGHLRYFFFTNPFKIYRMFNKFKPDILHVFYEPFTLMAFEIVQIAKLITPRPKIILESFENIRIKQTHFFRYFEKSNMKNANGLISVPVEGIDVWKWKGYKKEVYTCPIGFDDSLFYKRNVKKDQIRKICYVGRIVKEKGIIDLLKAYLELRKEHDLELHIIGSGLFKEELMKKYAVQGIVFHNSVNNNDLPEIYSQMDILILPSLTTNTWKEQFGRVLIEAMACGVVTIGSSSGEIPNVIGNEKLIYREGNVKELIQLLHRLLSDSKLLEFYSKQCLERAKSKFTWKIIAQRTKSIYDHILNCNEIGESGIEIEKNMDLFVAK